MKRLELDPLWETPGYSQELYEGEKAFNQYLPLCFSGREGLFYLRHMDQYRESEVIKLVSGQQPKLIALCRNARLNIWPVLCGNGEYVCSKGIYMTEERLWSKESVAVSALATGETQYFLARSSANYTSSRLMPYKYGFLLFDTRASRSGEDYSLHSRSYGVFLCKDGDFDPERYITLAEGRFNEWNNSGQNFDAALSFADDEDFLWLLSEELEKGRQKTPPRLEKYSLDGELLETRELSDWDGMANMIEERHVLPYDAGAAEFAVLGKNGHYLYINYQADAVFLEWKNGKYRQLGSPSVPEESATTLKQFYSVPPRCSGCKNSGDSHLADLFWFYKLSDLARPELLYAFDASSGRLFSVALPVEPDDSCLDYISASCGGDILLQRYRWQDQSRLEPDGVWFLSAESVRDATK